MQTSDRERDEAGSWRGRSPAAQWLLRIAALGVASLVVATGAASCSLIVDTNANQCDPTTVSKDCGGFPGLRNCQQNVCTVVETPPPCMTDTDCNSYAGATCVSHVCARSCTTDADCGTGGTCTSNKTCGSGVTQDGGTDGGAGCTKNADCTGMGTYYVCRKTKCVSLVNDLCTTVYATKTPASQAYLDDSAVIFGDILPTANNPDGPYGKLVEDSIKLALDDFGTVDGIPALTGGGSRPLVLVGCNDGVNEDMTDAAAHHLIDDLGVPAIIGYAFSGNTITVAKDVTIMDNVLLFTPSATSKLITDLESSDNDLVWRTCPSDNVQAQALSLYYCSVQAAAKAKYSMIDTTKMKVAIVNHSDAYGSGLGDALQALLQFNGKAATDPSNTGCAADPDTPMNGGPSDPNACYFRVDYGPSTAPDLTKIPNIVNFAPDIVFLFGFNEGVDVIFTQVEKTWNVPADGHYPFWVFSDGGEVGSLWASSMGMAADISTEAMRQRVSGSVPGTNATSWPAYGTFLTEFNSSKYASDGSADTIGPAGAYDILYLLAYSTVMVGPNPLTGPNLVKYGLTQMQKGPGLPQIQINRGNILSTFPQISTGKPVNVTGVSGPLPFNGKGDITTADIQIWCVPPASGGTDPGSTAINSGYYFDSANNKMTGSISATCGLMGYATGCM